MRWRRRLTLSALALCCAASAWAAAAAAQAPRPREAMPPEVAPVPAPEVAPVPGTLPSERPPAPAIPPPRPDWRWNDRIVYAFDRPARDLLTPAPELSQACRRGRFIQRTNLRYRAFGPGEQPLGVAYGKLAVNLVDPDGRRSEDMVYFFKDQDTARCTVLTAPQEALREWFVGP